MANYNKVILAGNLTRDPELSYTPSNTPLCKFGLAINRRSTDREGNRREETTFVDCVAWSKTAEMINQYFRKGRPILLDGRLQYSQWTSQEGQKRSKLEVVVENFHFVDSRPQSSEGSSSGADRSQSGGPPGQDGGGTDDNYRYPPTPSPTDVPF